MIVEPETAWTIATHLAELVTAHGLVEAGKGPVKRGAKAVVDWLRGHLPAEAQDNVTNVLHTPGPGRARNALEGQIASLLETHPDLLTQIRALLADARGDDNSQHQTVGDNSTAYQVRGSNNTISH
jgi:hypothetical protein